MPSPPIPGPIGMTEWSDTMQKLACAPKSALDVDWIQAWMQREERVFAEILRGQRRMEQLIRCRGEGIAPADKLRELDSLDLCVGGAEVPESISEVAVKQEFDMYTEPMEKASSDQRNATAPKKPEPCVEEEKHGDSGEHGHRSCLHPIVEHPIFEYCSAAAILIHSILIGAYVEYTASHGKTVHDSIVILNQCFVFVFMCEVLLKAAAEKRHYFSGPEKGWNIFDSVLVSMVVLELVIGIFTGGESKNKNVKTLLKIVEMIRTARVLRIFRVLRFSQTLRNILSKVFGLLHELFWITVLFVMLIFVLAVCLTQGSNDYLKGAQHYDAWPVNATEEKVEVYENFGSVSKSAYTLFLSISGGVLWGDLVPPLSRMSSAYVAIFMAYVALIILSVLNIITGIFVDASTQSSMHQKDVVEQKHHKLNMIQAQHLGEVFAELDTDNSGTISRAEFESTISTSNVQAYLNSLNIDTSDPEILFTMLDVDGNGAIKMDEFVEGCLRLRGGAKSADIHILIAEARSTKSAMKYAIEEIYSETQKLRCLVVGDVSGFKAAEDISPSRPLTVNRARCQSNGETC